MSQSPDSSYDSPVLASAYAVAFVSEHVTLNPSGIADFSRSLASLSSLPLPSASSWAEEPLHPIPADFSSNPKQLSDWIFTVSLLNFSFWSELEEKDRYGITWRDGFGSKGSGKDKRWTGYWSLPAAINRAIQDEGIQITRPAYWIQASDEQLQHAFRPDQQSKEEMPLLATRIKLLREAGQILYDKYDGSFHNLLLSVSQDQGKTCDALTLAQRVVDVFPAVRDEHIHPLVGKVKLWKRPQILVAELWAALSSVCSDADFPQISGIERLTMFADYRVPQILHSLSLTTYSPFLLSLLEAKTPLESGSELEICIRALSIVAVEELRQSVVKLLKEQGRDEEAQNVNAVILDFWLWNEAKRREKMAVAAAVDATEGHGRKAVECHRTRSIWY